MLHIGLVFLVMAIFVFLFFVPRAPDRRTTILNRQGIPRAFPPLDDASTESQARRDKTE